MQEKCAGTSRGGVGGGGEQGDGVEADALWEGWYLVCKCRPGSALRQSVEGLATESGSVRPMLLRSIRLRVAAG